MTRSPKAITALNQFGWKRIEPSGTRLWQDNYSNIFDAFKFLK